MKSHFQFSKKQRSGIFSLFAIIVILQGLYFFVASNKEDAVTSNVNIDAFKKELDSLRLVAKESQKPKPYHFNPNYISDYKGYTLGMTNEEIDRLHLFRQRGQWINSAKDFQEVTQVSDTLLAVIAPYFSFPEWLKKSKSQLGLETNRSLVSKNTPLKIVQQSTDLNTASAKDLQQIYGVGKILSERIVSYRNTKKGGFAALIELTEIYGLSDEVIARIKNNFVIKTPRPIDTINLNTASRDELVKIDYIDYDIAKYIIEERTLRDGFKSLDDLTKVEGFPVDKIAIIQLYLYL